MAPLFTKRVKALVPPEVIASLSDYGKYAWDAQQSNLTASILAVSRLQFDQTVQAEAWRAATELYQGARAVGGWALYGAWTAVHAFIPSQADEAGYRDIKDESLRFLHGLGMSVHEMQPHMRFDARLRYAELFPNDGIK